MVVHHSDDPLMLDYVSGALSEALSLAMATHLSLSPSGAQTYHSLNRIGGVLLEDMSLEDVSANDGAGDFGLASVLDRLDDEPAEAKAIQFNAVTNDTVPAPLRKYLSSDLNDLPWRKISPGVEEYELRGVSGDEKTSLLRIEAGRAMPAHTHSGQEMTVVLDGAYIDGAETYARGDLQVADGGHDHRPVADSAHGCICLVALDAPLKLTGKMGRFLNPFIRF